MSNPTPPTILRNLYAKLETMEKELNENSGSLSVTYNNNNDNIQNPIEEQSAPNAGTPMSPLTLPSNSNVPVNDVKKNYNVVDKFSKLTISDQRSSSFSNPSNNSSQPRYQENDYARASVRSDNSNSSRGRVSYSSNNNEKDNEYNSPKINYIRAAPTPPSINTYYNPQNQKYFNQRSFPNEDDTFNLESPYENEIPRYYGGSYNNSMPQNYQSPPLYDKMGSPSNNSYAFSPDSATFYNEMSIPNMDEYGSYVPDYKHQSDYSSKNDFSKSSINNSFDLNADLENHARSFGAGNESISETFSETKSFLAAVSEIDMNFNPDILKGKGKKYMKDLVNSNNFHKGGKLTICTNIFLNKKKTLFYALTTHRLYAFKEDRSDAELIAHYTIDKDAKVNKAGIYAGVRNFELTTVKDNAKSKEVHEFECETKEERDEWIHSINKVIQLHKYYGKTLPTLPQEKEVSYTSTLKTPNLSSVLPSPTMTPDGNSSFCGATAANTSFSSSYKSPSIPPSQYVPSVASQSSYSKVSPMYSNQVNINNGRRPSPQPLLVQSPPARPNGKPHSSPNINPIPIQNHMGSPNFSYMKQAPKNLPINQFINNQNQIPGRSTQPSPRLNYYQRSPMQRPQSGN